jgi:hypothetical protein
MKDPIKIKIEDLQYFEELLSSISKIVSGCKFIVDENGCTVRVKTHATTLRAYFKTTCLTSEVSCEFCLSEVVKLNKSIKVIAEQRKSKLESYIRKRLNSGPDSKTPKAELTAKFTEEFKQKESPLYLLYDYPVMRFSKDGIKFRFSTVASKVVEYSDVRAHTASFNETYGFKITPKMISKVVNISNITALSKPKVYMYKDSQDDQQFIVAEINDKAQKNCDVIGIPISNDFDGSWETPLVVNLEQFKFFNIINSDIIEIRQTEEGFLLINSSNKHTSVTIISTALRLGKYQ